MGGNQPTLEPPMTVSASRRLLQPYKPRAATAVVRPRPPGIWSAPSMALSLHGLARHTAPALATSVGRGHAASTYGVPPAAISSGLIVSCVLQSTRLLPLCTLLGNTTAACFSPSHDTLPSLPVQARDRRIRGHRQLSVVAAVRVRLAHACSDAGPGPGIYGAARAHAGHGRGNQGAARTHAHDDHGAAARHQCATISPRPDRHGSAFQHWPSP